MAWWDKKDKSVFTENWLQPTLRQPKQFNFLNSTYKYKFANANNSRDKI